MNRGDNFLTIREQLELIRDIIDNEYGGEVYSPDCGYFVPDWDTILSKFA